MNDKQVKDLYNAVLREVISTIRDDPLIMNMGVQSNVIDALEEKWKKNLATARDALNPTSGGPGDLVQGYHPRPVMASGIPPSFIPSGPLEPGYPFPRAIGGPFSRTIQPNQVAPRPPGMGLLPHSRYPEEIHGGPSVYSEDFPDALNPSELGRRQGFNYHDGRVHNDYVAKRLGPGQYYAGAPIRATPNGVFKPNPGYSGGPGLGLNPGAGGMANHSAATGVGLSRQSSNVIGGNQNPPGILGMKRTDSTVAVRNEEPLNDQPIKLHQEPQPDFRLELNLGDDAERSDNEDRVKKESTSDIPQSGIVHPHPDPQDQEKPVKIEPDASTKSRIKLEGVSKSDDEDDSLFSNHSDSDKKKKIVVPETSSQAPNPTQQHEALGKREVQSDSDEGDDDDDGSKDSDGLFNDGEDSAPPNIGDKLKKESTPQGTKPNGKPKQEPVNARTQAVENAIRPKETVKTEPLSSGSGSQNDERELCSEDDISEDSEFDAGNNSLLGYFLKTKRKKDKRKITFKNCVLRLDGREYVIHNGKGEFKWAPGNK